MNLPNRLTILRIILTFIFAFLIFQNGIFYKIFAAIIFAIASLTDFLDGYYAKKHNLSSDFGKLMDPIADKVLILVSFFIFVKMSIIPFWMVVVISFREILITSLRLIAIGKNKVIAAEKAGKYKTVSQIIAICFILFFIIIKESNILISFQFIIKNTIFILMYIAVFLTLYSGLSFFKSNNFFQLIKDSD